MRKRRWTLASLAGALTLTGCVRIFAPEKASRPYPFDLHVVEVGTPDGRTARAPVAIDIQVFRNGPRLEIVNSTATSYFDFDLWINQRYMKHVEAMGAGQRIRLDLRDFYDERGEGFSAGGLFRTEDPVPVRLVQIQTAPDATLIGLIAIKPGDEN